MTSYYHSAGSNFKVVQCVSCLAQLHSIYDPDVRDTCHECGGVSKIARYREDERQRRGLIPDWRGTMKKISTLFGPDIRS
jgi:hypothetical protein